MAYPGWPRIGLAIALLAGSIGLARTAPAADTGLTPAVRAELEALLATGIGETHFTPPGPPIDVSSLKDKLIFTIPSSTAIPFCDVVDKQMDEFAKRLGMRHEVWHPTRSSANGCKASPPRWRTRPI